MSDVKYSNTTTTIEEAIPKVREAIEYLKTCKDFSTEKAYENLDKIRQYAWGGLSCCDIQRALGKRVADSDFGLLFPEMWKLTECLGHIPDYCQGLMNLDKMLGTFQCFTDASPELAASLGKSEAIKLLFEGLKKVTAMEIQFPGSKVLIDITESIFGILHNSIRHCSSNQQLYRSNKAIPILESFLKGNNILRQTWALLILAYVVTDEESKMFATEEIGVSVLTVFFVEAVKSGDHLMGLISNGTKATIYSAYELLDAINHLAINDENKKAVAAREAIPHITKMLQADFTPDEQRVAADALWNLSFISEIRKSDELQKAIPSKFVTGRTMMRMRLWMKMRMMKM